MTLRPTICWEPVNPTSPDLGVPTGEIVLQDRGGNAAPDFALSDEDTATIQNSSGGDRHVGNQRVTARHVIGMTVDGLTAKQQRQLNRLRRDGREVHFTPGWGPQTAACYPLHRSVKAYVKGTDLAVTRAQKAYVWDDDDRVFYEFAAGSPALPFDGPMIRYLRTGFGWVNRAAVKHPDSGGVGWTLVTGAGSAAYTTDVLTPVLALRTHSTKKGRARLVGTPNLAGAGFEMGATGIVASTNHVVASIVLAWRGSMTLTLRDSASTVIATVGPIEGDGRDHLYKLNGANASSGTTASLRVTLNDSSLGADAGNQEALVGPVFIGNAVDANSSPEIPDWIDTAASDVITQSTQGFATSGLTIRFCARFRNWKLGFLEMGDTTKLYLRKSSAQTGNTLELVLNFGITASFAGIGTTPVVLADGDWFHCVVQIDGSHVRCWINGQLHGSSPVGPLVIPANYGPYLRVGAADSTYLLDGSGMFGLVIDNDLWSAQRVADDYDTVLGESGLPLVLHGMGRKMRIDSISWQPISGSARDAYWKASMTLRQTKELADFAPLQLQEGTS